MEETLSDSVERYEKAGLLRGVARHPCRLPHLIPSGMWSVMNRVHWWCLFVMNLRGSLFLGFGTVAEL